MDLPHDTMLQETSGRRKAERDRLALRFRCREVRMRMRYLIVADPVDTLNPEFDLGVSVSRELLARGIPVDYLDLLASPRDLTPERYLSSLPVQEIRRAEPGGKRFWELAPVRRADVREYGVVLQRKDPPVDPTFIAYARLWEDAPPEVIQVNRPPAVYQLSEHTLHLSFPEYAAPTHVCATVEELEEAVRRQPGEAVLKPHTSYCGIGIEFLSPDVARQELERYWRQWGPTVIVQPYLEEIERTGDLRILTIGQHVLGSVLRVPAQGSRLANLHAGGSARRLDPSPRQLEACRAVAAQLNPKGLLLLGLDFIGEHLTEINITSPTTIVQISRVMGKNAERELVDELERMAQQR